MKIIYVYVLLLKFYFLISFQIKMIITVDLGTMPVLYIYRIELIIKLLIHFFLYSLEEFI